MAAAALFAASTPLAAVAGRSAAAPAHSSHLAADPAQELAERYAPLVAVQRQPEACGDGEPYQPEDVAIILDQPDVVLRDAGGKVIATAPGATELYAAPDGSNLDLPGNTLRPGCDYERRFGRRALGRDPVVYARVVNDPSDPDRLAVQYWMYFVFNDWNDVHESDWEMVQIAFAVGTVDEALSTEPVTMALSQHFGAERRPWGDVSKVDDRPVIYPAAGSHAIHYSQARWFGMNGDEGFGCDDTRGPSDRLDPNVVLLPDEVTADGGFGWLGFRGRWGQRAPAINDAELGIQYTTQWQTPLAWMDGGRDGAVTVPAFDIGVVDWFCTASATVSHALNYMLDRPWLLLVLVVAAIVVVVVLARRTVWRPADPSPLHARRRGGQVLTAAARLVLRRPRRYLPVSLIAIGGGVLAALLQPAMLEHTFVGDLAYDGERTPAVGLLVAVAAGAAVTAVTVFVGVLVGLTITDEIEGPPRPKALWRALTGRGVLPLAAQAAGSLLTGPLSILLTPLLSAAAPAAVAERLTLRAALLRSAQLTHGRRVRTWFVTAAASTAALLAAPLVGVVALFVTARSFAIVSVFGGLVNAAVLPWFAAVLYLSYADLRAADYAAASPGDPPSPSRD